MSKILSGRPVRDKIALSLLQVFEQLERKPHLAIIQVGLNPQSTSYIRQKQIFGEKIGAKVEVFNLPESATSSQIISQIKDLNEDESVHGIIVQIPLPFGLDRQVIIDSIDPVKDVDGLTTTNQDLLEKGKPQIIPATARGIFELLNFYQIKLASKKVVVMGRSKLVGSPTAKLLALKGAEVSIIHSQTQNPELIAKKADILIVAIGQARLVGLDYIKSGAVVIDVGISRLTGERLEEEIGSSALVGDVDFDQVKDLVGAISPVPGGVGPMTVSALFENLLDAYEMQKRGKSV